MPFLNIISSVDLPADQRDPVLAAVSAAVADATGKPERYMMVGFECGSLMFAGMSGPAAFVDVRAIGGLTPEVNAKISSQVCALFQKWLSVPGERVYLTFIDVPATHWGNNGKTFG